MPPAAHRQLAGGQAIAVHDEHAIDTVAVLECGERQREDLIDFAALAVNPGERTGGLRFRDAGAQILASALFASKYMMFDLTQM